MTLSLNDSLQVVLPQLSSALVPPDALGRVQQLARRLAPVHCGGFECRLSDDDRVDFQQRILNRDDEPLILHRHIASSDLAFHPAWRRIGDLCAELGIEASVLGRALSILWLEFDLQQPISETPIPSIFVTLDEAEVESRSADSLVELVNEVHLTLLERKLPFPTASILRRVIVEKPEGTGVHHVGFMLSRGRDAARLVMRGFTPEALKTYLARVAWLGDPGKLSEALARLPDFVNPLVLSLDVGDRISAPIGLEYFPGMHPDLEPRWSALFDFLVTNGLCLPDKADALLAWPGHTEPSASPVPWPEHLLLDSLLTPSHHFTVLGRRLSHIKMVCRPDGPMEVKGYFGFGPLHLELRTEERSTAEVHPSFSIATDDTERDIRPERLLSSMDAGISYLLGTRDPEGWWREFRIQAGSDEWVTAYVGASLAGLSDERAQGAALRAWRLLSERHHPAGGWGFNALSPKDADSTSWALRLAQAVAEDDQERAIRARTFLEEHVGADGGVATFLESSRIRLLSRIALDAGVEGWCSVHTDVTAAAAALEGIREKACRYLKNAQLDNGSWEGYWIGDDEYTTALAVEALAQRAEPSDSEAIHRAVRWAVGRLGADGSVTSETHRERSAFATALSVRILIRGVKGEAEYEPIRRAALWLLACQRPDGSWPPSFRFRHPPANVIHSERKIYECIHLDERSTFTTATVLTALEAVARLLNRQAISCADWK